jgi:uncharacterized protein (TIGR00730 family)
MDKPTSNNPTRGQAVPRPGLRSNPAICVFAGAAHGDNPRYSDAARAIGAGIAALGGSMVFGGGGLGLMGEAARAATKAGAQVQGVMPAFMQAMEPQVSPQEKLIVTPHMQERKTLMLQMSDAFVVLPGGLGTLDEFFEVVTEAQLGVHAKPIIVVNVDGYFDALDTMLRQTVKAGFAKPPILDLYHLADGAASALVMLQTALARGTK